MIKSPIIYLYVDSKSSRSVNSIYLVMTMQIFTVHLTSKLIICPLWASLCFSCWSFKLPSFLLLYLFLCNICLYHILNFFKLWHITYASMYLLPLRIFFFFSSWRLPFLNSFLTVLFLLFFGLAAELIRVHPQITY